MVGDALSSFLPRTMGAAVDRVRGFGTMADDPTSTMGTDRCQFLNGAFEAIEDVPTPGGNNLEGEVVVVAADFADRHRASLGRTGSVAALSTKLRSEAEGRQQPCISGGPGAPRRRSPLLRFAGAEKCGSRNCGNDFGRHGLELRTSSSRAKGRQMQRPQVQRNLMLLFLRELLPIPLLMVGGLSFSLEPFA